ncbi:ribosomal protein L13 [Pseudoscourfieldia marina]
MASKSVAKPSCRTNTTRFVAPLAPRRTVAPRTPMVPPQRAVLSESELANLVSGVSNLGADPWEKTYYPKGADRRPEMKNWYVVDAEGQTLGRLATLVANLLRGKTVPTYTTSADMGGFVVVVNAEKVTVGGRKAQQKLYRRHATGRPGSMKEETFENLQKRVPERIVEKAVKGMLPKGGALGRDLFRHLKVYKGDKHPHEAQTPIDCTHLVDASSNDGAKFPSVPIMTVE